MRRFVQLLFAIFGRVAASAAEKVRKQKCQMTLMLRLRRSLVWVMCFVFLGCAGCGTYFRTGEMSYEEMQQKNREKQQESENQTLLNPGALIRPK
jgi:hypothetical protein